MTFLPTSQALRYHHIGFLDSVFFVLPRLSLDSILKVNFNWQAACLCKDLLVLIVFLLIPEFCFASIFTQEVRNFCISCYVSSALVPPNRFSSV